MLRACADSDNSVGAVHRAEESRNRCLAFAAFLAAKMKIAPFRRDQIWEREGSCRGWNQHVPPHIPVQGVSRDEAF